MAVLLITLGKINAYIRLIYKRTKVHSNILEESSISTSNVTLKLLMSTRIATKNVN